MELKLLVDDEWITLKSIEDFKTLKDKGHACCNLSIDNEFEFEMLGNFIYTDLEDMKEKHQKLKSARIQKLLTLYLNTLVASKKLITTGFTKDILIILMFTISMT